MFYATWQKLFVPKARVIPTELGLCRTTNFCDQKEFLQHEGRFSMELKLYSGIERVGAKIPEKMVINKTQPFTTNSVNLGFTATANNDDMYDGKKMVDPFLLMIHSPFELPTEESQKFVISGFDFITFYVTPQLKTIDDTMIGMEPNE